MKPLRSAPGGLSPLSEPGVGGAAVAASSTRKRRGCSSSGGGARRGHWCSPRARRRPGALSAARRRGHWSPPGLDDDQAAGARRGARRRRGTPGRSTSRALVLRWLVDERGVGGCLQGWATENCVQHTHFPWSGSPVGSSTRVVGDCSTSTRGVGALPTARRRGRWGSSRARRRRGDG